MSFIDKLSLPLLAAITVLMLGAPFVPEPHLVEKAKMLLAGTLTRPLDLFDVFWHLLPAALLTLKLLRAGRPKTTD